MRAECKLSRSTRILILVATTVMMVVRTSGFMISKPKSSGRRQQRPSTIQLLLASSTSSSPSTIISIENDGLSQLSTIEIKDRLVDLLSRMMGTAEDFRLVEAHVNTLEQRYVPTMTLEFLNLVMGGDWQLLFSTNLATTTSWSKPSALRVRDFMQRIETQGLEGRITNSCHWDWTEDDDSSSSDAVAGTFATKCSYKITQGARMSMELDDHILRPARGSNVPKNVPKLVSLLHRAMPKELFDPSDHAMDITYLDGDLRIVRLTGPRLEGVRDIFIRRASLEPNTTTLSQPISQGSLE